MRLFTKTSGAAAPVRSFSQSWRWYVRGNVVSQHAKRLIAQFMAACCGKSSREHDGEDGDEGHDRKLKELPANDLALGRVHAVLDRMSEAKPGTAEQKSKIGTKKVLVADLESEDEESADKKALRKSEQIQGAMEMTAKLWAREGKQWSGLPFDQRHTSLKHLPTQAQGSAASRKKNAK
jgi:hypothetical protein